MYFWLHTEVVRTTVTHPRPSIVKTHQNTLVVLFLQSTGGCLGGGGAVDKGVEGAVLSVPLLHRCWPSSHTGAFHQNKQFFSVSPLFLFLYSLLRQLQRSALTGDRGGSSCYFWPRQRSDIPVWERGGGVSDFSSREANEINFWLSKPDHQIPSDTSDWGSVTKHYL